MWRSVLFIPVLEERFLARAAERGADAIVLDLEASIADARKGEARAALPAVVDRLNAASLEVLVRINMPWRAAFHDLEAAVRPGVSALLLAGCDSAGFVRAVDRVMDEIEAERGLARGAIALVPLLESARAMVQAASIAQASPRIAALTFGIEDYVADLRATPTPELLDAASLQVIHAARAAGVVPMVVPETLANLDDPDAFEAAARRGRAMGSEGGFAVHPVQVERLNRAFTPSPEEIEWARRVVAAAEDAQARGLGAVRLDGRMIDLPVVVRARRLLGATPGPAPSGQDAPS